MKARCFDPTWRYVRSEATDVSKTIARERRRLKEAEAAKQAEEAAKQAQKSSTVKRVRAPAGES